MVYGRPSSRRRYHEAAYGAFAEEDEDFGAGQAPPRFAGFGQPQSLGAPRDVTGAAPMPHLEPEDDFALRPDAFERPAQAPAPTPFGAKGRREMQCMHMYEDDLWRRS